LRDEELPLLLPLPLIRRLLGYKQLDVEIVALDDTQMATQALVENLQREGLADIEKANGIKRLMGLKDKSFSREELAN
jgi:ParB-like chromosome segregation protein Spo0J